MLSDEQMSAIAKRAVKGWRTDEEEKCNSFASARELMLRAYEDVRQLYSEAMSWRSAMKQLERGWRERNA